MVTNIAEKLQIDELKQKVDDIERMFKKSMVENMDKLRLIEKSHRTIETRVSGNLEQTVNLLKLKIENKEKEEKIEKQEKVIRFEQEQTKPSNPLAGLAGLVKSRQSGDIKNA